jgi:hypothetical protein
LQLSKSIGIENFEKKILFEATSSEEMYEKERELVSINSGSYNLKTGGLGGWDYVHRNGLTNKNKTRDHYVRMGKAGNDVFQEHLKDANFRDEWLMLVHHPQTEATKRKIAQTLFGKKRNKIWITNGVSNVFHSSDTPIPDGFSKGRVV